MNREQFRQMTGRQRLEYVWMYYKLPIFAGVLILAILVSTIRHFATRKESVLYLAQVNVAAGEDLNRQLDEAFVTFRGGNPKKQQVSLYKGLYLSENAATENHEYAYASAVKLMAAINAKELDLVLMNREAYDLCSRKGYLTDLSEILPEKLSPFLRENEVVLEDNALEVSLNEETVYREVTRQTANALCVNALPVFAAAGFPEEVYLGILANTPRMPACADYLQYLAG